MTLLESFKPISGVRIEIDPSDAPRDKAAIEIIWNRIRADNPRTFDGPILGFLGEQSGTIYAKRESYKLLAVQTRSPALIDPPVMQLAVTGVLVARDAKDVPHVLMGKRSDDTRIYGSLWELGPSGGIDPPSPDTRTLDESDVIRQLTIECQDELGIPGDFADHRVFGLILDDKAMSADIVVRLDLDKRVDDLGSASSNWEYSETAWIPANELEDFGEREKVIPPTAVLLPIVQDLLTS